MRYPTVEELRELSLKERLRLIGDVWETFVGDPESLPLNDEYRQEIDRRLDSYDHDPNRGRDWPDARRRITDG